MILPNDIQKCTGQTRSGIRCNMKQNCKRYLSYTLDDEVYVPVASAPESIEENSLNCELKIIAYNEN